MNKKMAIVGALLMSVAVTGYSVSGTYAKYVSQVDLVDEARVARFELKATDANGTEITGRKTIDLFENSYWYNGKQYVKALNDTDRVIAPGTEGTYTLNLDGVMETAYYLNFKVNSVDEPIVYYTLKADGTVDKMDTDKANLTGDIKEYHPLKYTVEYTKNGSPVITDPTKQITNKNATEVKGMLDAYNTYAKANPFGAGKLADLQYVIKWKWDTNNSEGSLSDTDVNKLDTYAGQNVDKLKTAKFDVSVSATQSTASEDNNDPALNSTKKSN